MPVAEAIDTASDPEGRAMLQKVVIEHFRSCHDLTLDAIGPSLVLVGPNGSGKTNILKAILWAAKSALSHEPMFHGPWAESFALEFLADGPRYRYASKSMPDFIRNDNIIRSITLEESIESFSASGDREELASRSGPDVRLSDGRSLRIAPSTPFLPFLFAFLAEDDPLINRLRPIKEFLGRIRYYSLDEPSEAVESGILVTYGQYRAWETKSAGSGEREDSVLCKLLNMFLESPADFEEVKSIVCGEGLGLIEDISVSTFNVDEEIGGTNAISKEDNIYFIKFTTKSRRRGGNPMFDFGFGELSLGTRRVIRMVVAMIFDKSSVMLVEHPEDGIHRGLTAKVFSLLKTYTDPMQLIASSHSPLVFDMLDPSEVRIVSMRDGRTEAHALPADQIEQARRYIDDEGSFSEYLEVRHDV